MGMFSGTQMHTITKLRLEGQTAHPLFQRTLEAGLHVPPIALVPDGMGFYFERLLDR